MTSVRVYSPVFENFNKLKSKSSRKKFLHVYPISNLNKTFKKKSNMIQLFFKSLFKIAPWWIFWLCQLSSSCWKAHQFSQLELLDRWPVKAICSLHQTSLLFLWLNHNIFDLFYRITVRGLENWKTFSYHHCRDTIATAKSWRSFLLVMVWISQLMHTFPFQEGIQ